MKLGKIVVLFVFLLGCVSAGFAYPAEKEFKLNLQAGGIKTFEIDCGSGYLKIKGEEGLKQIEVTANLVVKGIDEDKIKEFKEDHVTLTLAKKRGKAVLVSKIESGVLSSIFKSKSARIDLDIRVPKKMVLDVDDGSGLIEISDVNAAVELEDGSGSIEMENIGGAVTIDDGSGSIVLDNINGNLAIEDGSGSIKVTGAAGNVDIDDNSGTIEVFEIKGSVTVEDGSGSILINGVEKNVNIKRAGSGSVTIRNVKGTVKR